MKILLTELTEALLVCCLLIITYHGVFTQAFHSLILILADVKNIDTNFRVRIADGDLPSEFEKKETNDMARLGNQTNLLLRIPTFTSPRKSHPLSTFYPHLHRYLWAP